MTYELVGTHELFDRGVEHFLKDTPSDLAQAIKIFNKIASENEENEAILYYLGSAYMRRKEYGVAKLLLCRAIELKKDFPEAHNNLGYIYRNTGQREKGAEHFKAAYKLVPDEEAYLINIASIYSANSTPDKCIEYCKKVLKKNPDNNIALNNLAISYLEKGNWDVGFTNYWARLDIEDRTRRNYNAPDHTPEWDGKSIGTVVVWGEQGMGDEIMFASCLADAAKVLGDKGTLIFDAHERLADIFRDSFKDIPVYGTRKKDTIAWPAQYKHIDYQIAIGDLPRFFRKKDTDFPRTPYLQADPKHIESMNQRLFDIGKPKPVIGISWMGGIPRTHMDVRHIPLEQWTPIFEEFKDKVHFVSLQYHTSAGDTIKEYEKKHKGIKIHHWKDVMADYDLTAGLVANIDLVISVPQTVVHLAGALGTATWQLTPKQALWQMGPYGKDMPWYGCVMSIWQSKNGDWEQVMNTVKEKLCSLYQKSTAA